MSRSRRFGPFVHSGTALADYEYLSCPSFSDHADVPARQNAWGGARNRRDRTSDCITLAQATGLREAAVFAVRIGLSLNRHITIHWAMAGVGDDRAAAATARFLKLASDWLDKRGHRFAWVWVRENGARKRSHVHILAHVPAGLGFGRMQRRWLRQVTGAPYRAKTIRTKRIAGRANAATAAPAAYWQNLGNCVEYLLKGVSPETAQALGLERVKPGGRITGKRVSWSQNIGAAARAKFPTRRAGW